MRRIASLLSLGIVATVLPGVTPAQAATPSTSASTESHPAQKPSWRRCDRAQPAAFQCATIKVPLDYRKPAGRKIEVAISRYKTSKAAKRHGVLLFNPGGPGGEGLDMPLMALQMLSKSVRERYDLIGFDPRGVGHSTPVTCGLTEAEGDPVRPYKRATFDRDVAWARKVARKCRARSGDLLPFITTRNTARDMDAIRAALGERKISYLGYSYGTYLGAVYTQMFPRRSDRMVLDSGVDPARIWRGMIQVWASGAEPVFTRWTKWAARRDAEYHLGTTPTAVSRKFWRLVARAEREPIVIDGQKFTGDDIRSARAVFFSLQPAAEFVAALNEGAAGRSAHLPELPVAPLDGKVGPARTVPADNGAAAFFAVICADTRAWPREPAQYRRDAVRDRARYPLYGDFVSNITPCAFWQKGVEPATRVRNEVPVLTVQNEWDSQTPLASGRGLHRALMGSRMVTVDEGEGHGVYLLAENSCVDEKVDRYLTGGRLPSRDVTCGAAPPRAERHGTVFPELPRFPLDPARF
ncbi:alpha/beta hydrolase [Streptomyces sp. NPDC006879]|uniref:alpha/beta hydrolase n=1 Tax=Streptomyces sp. NPDC006879 TaxID=3364767 RepID=UPI0036A1DDD7